MRNTIIKVLAVFPCLLPFACLSQQTFSKKSSASAFIQSSHQDPTDHLSQHEVVGTIVWLGLNNNWNDAQNWYLSSNPEYGLPTLNTDVLIQPVASGIYPVISKNQVASCNILTITSGGPSLTINNGADLNCFGDFNNSGILANRGKINLMGVGNQAFPGSGTIEGMSVLQISKTAGTVAVNRNFYIDSALLPTSGVLALGNFDVTLNSTAAHTAYVGIVGSTTGFTYNTGRFVVQRYISQTRKWQLLAVPTNGTQSIRDAWQDGGSSTTVPTGFGVQITAPVITNGIDAFSNSASMIYQVGCSQSFTPVLNTLNPLSNTKGYFLFVYGNRAYSANSAAGPPTTLQSRGKLFVGNQVVEDQPPAVSAAANITNGDDHMSVSNPFASPINFTSVYNLAANSSGNFKSNFKVWDPSQPGLYESGLYQTITGPTGWLATPGGGAIYNASSNYSDIQSGQAFFVEANASGTVSMRFNETVKSVQNRLVNRGNRFDNIDPAQLSMISSFVVSSTGKLLDGNRVVLDSEYTNAVDDNDACKLWNQGANFAIWKHNKSIAVETRPLLQELDTIQYELYGLYEGSYQLHFSMQLVNAPSLDAFLIDRYLNAESPVSLTANSSWDFSVNSDAASNAANRFYLVFRKKPLVFKFESISASWFMSTKARVEWRVSNQQEISSFELQRGTSITQFQPIESGVVASGTDYSKVDLAPSTADNFYRVKAIHTNGAYSFSETVQLIKSGNEKILIFPNPVQHKLLNIQTENFAAGTYIVQLWNAVGALIHQQTVQLATAKMNFTIQLKQDFAAGNYQLSICDEKGKRVTEEQLIIQ